MEQWQGAVFWVFLSVFGLVMLVVLPRAKTEGSFFAATAPRAGLPRSGC